MFRALNYLWSCCYLDSYGAGAAGVLSPPACGARSRNAPRGRHLLARCPFPKPQNPNECVFLLNGHGFNYETKISGLRRVNISMAFIFLVCIFQAWQRSQTALHLC